MDEQICRHARRARRGLTIFLIVVLPCACLAQSTQPATAPSIASSELKTLVTDLGNRNAEVRDAARSKLMGLTRDDLRNLRSAIAGQTLSTAQVAALREIVLQVFLSTEPYVGVPGTGFLGVKNIAVVRLSSIQPDQAEVAQPDDPDVKAATGEKGIIIPERLIGFAGFRYFDPGDIVLAVETDPPVRMDNVYEFKRMISQHGDDSLTFRVVRRGTIIHVTLKPNNWPASVQDGPGSERMIEDFRQPREQAAEQYWQENFASQLVDKVSTAR